MDFVGKEEAEATMTADETKPQPILGIDYNSSTNGAANVWLQQSASTATTGQQEQTASSENAMITPISPLSTSSNGNGTEMRSNDSGDAEGVWSPDIDQAFHEALQIYPPCGRRKIILSDEGKMYGRNELIARYIKIRCGKTRTRKQVSSHIQVLARKKQREDHSKLKGGQREHQDILQPPPSTTTGSISPNCQIGNSIVEVTNTGNNSSARELNLNRPILPLNNSAESTLLAASAAAVPIPSHNIPSLAAQPLASLISSAVNRDQIASMQAQMLRAASAISNSMVATSAANSNWPYTLNAANNLLNNHQSHLYNIATSTAFGANYALKLATTNGGDVASALFESTSATNNLMASTTIASSKLVLNGLTAYIEQNMKGDGSRIEIVQIHRSSNTPLEKISFDLVQSKYPPILQELFKKGPTDAFFLAKCWANMNFEIGDEQNTLFAVDSYYESAEKFDITVSTKVCSFGNEVVEKVEIYSPIDDEEAGKSTGIWHFRLERSPMCEYMVRFISELKKLQEPSLMNSVLENFTVLQIVTNKANDEALMVIGFIFEVRDDGEDEIYTNIYRLADESSN